MKSRSGILVCLVVAAVAQRVDDACLEGARCPCQGSAERGAGLGAGRPRGG